MKVTVNKVQGSNIHYYFHIKDEVLLCDLYPIFNIKSLRINDHISSHGDAGFYFHIDTKNNLLRYRLYKGDFIKEAHIDDPDILFIRLTLSSVK